MRVLLIVIALILIAMPVHAQVVGLHNFTKKFTAVADMVEADWSDPVELARTWQASVVRIPTGDGFSKIVPMDQLRETLVGETRKIPTIIYLHGCSGLWAGSLRRVRFFADNGFLVIAPASFARKKFPKSCDPATHSGGLYRGTLKIRQFDAGHAIEEARKLPFVDPNNIFLVGLSQGAITTATFEPRNDQQRVSARVVEGWTCNAGWFEYAGIKAPDNEPVLTLVGAKDPWFQHPITKGDCGFYVNEKNGSRSIVFKDGPLASEHALLDFKEPKRLVLDFLKRQMAQ